MLEVSIEKVPRGQAAQIRVSFYGLGVECIRGVFAFADSKSDKCVYSFMLECSDSYLQPIIEEWVKAAFEVEIVHNAAALFDHSRQMGVKYISAADMTDANNHYTDAMDKLIIQRQIMDQENAINAVAPDRYSVFEDYYNNSRLEGRFNNV